MLVGREDDHFARWEANMSIDIHIGRYGLGEALGLIVLRCLCGLLYLDHQSLASAR